MKIIEQNRNENKKKQDRLSKQSLIFAWFPRNIKIQNLLKTQIFPKSLLSFHPFSSPKQNIIGIGRNLKRAYQAFFYLPIEKQVHFLFHLNCCIWRLQPSELAEEEEEKTLLLHLLVQSNPTSTIHWNCFLQTSHRNR